MFPLISVSFNVLSVGISANSNSKSLIICESLETSVAESFIWFAFGSSCDARTERPYYRISRARNGNRLTNPNILQQLQIEIILKTFHIATIKNNFFH